MLNNQSQYFSSFAIFEATSQEKQETPHWSLIATRLRLWLNTSTLAWYLHQTSNGPRTFKQSCVMLLNVPDCSDGCLTISEDPWPPSCTCLMYAAPNYGVCQPSLAWLHTWRGCPSAREDPDCSRPLRPPSSVAHTQKWTTSSSRLAITPLAAWNRKFVSAPSLSEPSTRAIDKLPTTLCLLSQSAIPEEAKATDSPCSPDNETHHLFFL